MIEKDGTGLISRWNSAFLHTLEDLVTPEFLQPSFEFPATTRKIPLSSPLFIVPAAGIHDDKPAMKHPRVPEDLVLVAREEETEKWRWPFTAGQPRYANSSRHR